MILFNLFLIIPDVCLQDCALFAFCLQQAIARFYWLIRLQAGEIFRKGDPWLDLQRDPAAVFLSWMAASSDPLPLTIQVLPFPVSLHFH